MLTRIYVATCRYLAKNAKKSGIYSIMIFAYLYFLGSFKTWFSASKKIIVGWTQLRGHNSLIKYNLN